MRWVIMCAVLGWATVSYAEVTAGVETGRMFSVAAGSFVLASSPSMEISRGPLSLGAAISISREGVFEKDLTATWSKDIGKKTTLVGYVGTYWYTGVGRDWSWSVSVRRTLR